MSFLGEGTRFQGTPRGTAEFSLDDRYRYTLTRTIHGAPPGRAVLFVMLNPSTADGLADDATIRRCIGFARSWGYAQLFVGNLFALRSTDPRGLLEGLGAKDPIGPENDRALRAMVGKAERVVCAWGAHAVLGKMLAERAEYVENLILGAGGWPGALGHAKSGQPLHPLRLRADLQIVPHPPTTFAPRGAA